MYSRLSMVLMPILAVALIGAGYWGYQEHREKNAILIKAENQYQRAFHDLSFHIDKLQTELGNTLTASSTSHDVYRRGLANVWRLTSQAQSEINQLPLTLMPFNHTEQFLANLANFSYRTAVRDMTKQPLSEQEMTTLSQLYTHAQDIRNQLRDTQGKVIANNLRWMDVETALATQKEPRDNTIIDGFQTVDKKIGKYSEVNWGPTALAVHDEHKRVQMLAGRPETPPDEIKKKAARFVPYVDPNAMQVTDNGKGTDFPTYSVRVARGKNAEDIHMDFTKQGGHLLAFAAPRTVASARLGVREARDIAAQYLDEHGYPNMNAVSYDRYDHVATITFARRQNDVLVYPEKAAVRVALDNGEVLGLVASDYVFEHKDRQIAAPKLSAEEAKKTLNPKLDVASQSLALIRNELDQEVLCHEFIGKLNGSTYRIFINADNGTEERIDTVKAEDQQAEQKA
ncbi:sporulation protein [Gordoniibacillus kamchatkensis]|uniref:Sporulation protein n=1 Tax=Gordoniibacillus kamchatkensis TaxID=1590651 RepID=A0ABR5AKH8_9BACL|nr:germination protein YpeB [Paenibacillus sp. VKM B-2647]KIL41524.1 sporulation protein [Paenibacillus sp. VKM B-2647]